MPQSTERIYKYRIQELLNAMPGYGYKKALKELPQLLSLSESSFNRLRYMDIDDSASAKGDQLRVLSDYFGVTMDELHTTQAVTS